MNTTKRPGLRQEKVLDQIDAFASTKNLTKEEMCGIVEDCLRKTWEYVYGIGYNLEIKSNEDEMSIYRLMDVVEQVEDIKTQTKGLNIGETVKEKFRLDHFPIRAIQYFSDELQAGINVLKKHKEFLLFKNDEGKLVSCVYSLRRGVDSIVTISGIYKAILPQRLSVRKEKFAQGDKLRCRIAKVEDTLREYRIILDRRSNEFVEELMKEIIPEVESGVVVVKRIVRIPGFICKVLVTSDASYNPVGSCIGFKSQRRRAIMDELRQERIDFLLWSDDFSQLVYNCFTRIDIVNITVHEEYVDVVVRDDHYIDAMSRNTLTRSNTRVLDMLVGKQINIIKEGDILNRSRDALNDQLNELESLGADREEVSFLLERNFSLTHIDLNSVMKDNTKTAIEQYLKQQKMKNKEEFINRGGQAELFDKLSSLPFEVIMRLLDKNINSLDELRKYDNSHDLSNYTSLDIDACILMIELSK